MLYNSPSIAWLCFFYAPVCFPGRCISSLLIRGHKFLKLWARVARVSPCSTKSPHFNITPQERAQFDSLRQFFIGNWGTAGGEKVYFSKPSVGESWPEHITDWYVIIKHWPSGGGEEEEEGERDKRMGARDGEKLGWLRGRGQPGR